MGQKPVEIILMRQLADTLAMPIFIVDPAGTLLFYNEPAERILGLRFDETGELPRDQWASLWQPTTDDGTPLGADRLPLAIAIAERRAVHGACWIQGLDGSRRRIEITAFPLIAAPQQLLGATAIFWEDER